MIKRFSKMSQFTWLKRVFVFSVIAYGTIVSILLIRLDPKPLVIGVDPYGTRLVTSEKDPILKAEKDNFIKRFLIYLYNYDETNFDDRISIVGDSMSIKSWDKRKLEFITISSRIKNEPLVQKGKIIDLREIDETHYEADLDIHVQSRLRENSLKIRVAVELKSSPRSSIKPYPWEVTNYDEQTFN